MTRERPVLPALAWNDRPSRAVLLAGVLAVVAGTGLRLGWVALVPYNDAPDEFCHFAMVRFMRTEGRIPTMADVPDPIPVSYPVLSPVGYFPCVATSLLCPADDPDLYWYARLGNVAVGMATLWLGFLAALRFAPGQPTIAIVTVWGMALQPQLVFINAYTNNDSAMILGCTALFYLWGKRVGSSITVGQGAVIGLVSGLTLLTKTNSAAVVLAGVPILADSLVGRSANWRRALGVVITIGVVGAATLAPWFAWNWHHHGSLTGVEIHRQWWFECVRKIGIQQGFLNRSNWDVFIIQTWRSFWASFGYCSTWPRPPAMWGITAAAAVCALAFLGFVATTAISARRDETARRTLWQLVAIGLAMAGTLVLHVLHSRHFGFSPQGRYLMPVCWGWMLALSAGAVWLRVPGRPIPVGALLLLGSVGWLQAASWKAEQRSNRLRQPDRRVTARQLSYAGDLPSPNGSVDRSIGTIGRASVDWSTGSFELNTRDAGAGFAVDLTEEGAINQVVADLCWLGGSMDGGTLELVRQGEVLSSIPFRHGGHGAYRFRFSTGEFSALPADAIRIRPSGGACRIRVRRLEIHDDPGAGVRQAR